LFYGTAGRFYPIVDAGICRERGMDPRAVAAACFRAGATILQLRVKSASSAGFLALASGVVGDAAQFGATVIVNDRADIARMSGAGGVHVGQEDLTPTEVRAVAGHTVVGLSTHNPEQITAGLASAADYIAVGPIFGTATKETGYDARGLGLVEHAAGRGKPIVAIGGITLERAPLVIGAGAASVAVITDLLAGGDPETRARDYLRALA
jgi:thiamine-phosphate pyrophosphorylase